MLKMERRRSLIGTKHLARIGASLTLTHRRERVSGRSMRNEFREADHRAENTPKA
jgi:hypothetical protein